MKYTFYTGYPYIKKNIPKACWWYHHMAKETVFSKTFWFSSFFPQENHFSLPFVSSTLYTSFVFHHLQIFITTVTSIAFLCISLWTPQPNNKSLVESMISFYQGKKINTTFKNDFKDSKWVDQKTMVHLHNGILCSREKEGAYTLCDSMDGTGEHYAKWHKPGSERQIPYDLT